ncbi:MAG: HEAT repeat domain-containing protein, partial [Deltaproteobacteria bacterium]|nr:HEAT repeat domain-containing protein [Deltaproteobacteria bacterium]
PHIIESYLEDDKKRLYVLSVIVRATPLDYPTYMRYVQIPVEKGKEEIIKDFVRAVFDHLGEIISLLEKWIVDIDQSKDIAKRLSVYINDPDPQVRRSVAYALAQMNYKKVIPEIITLLKDPYLWVRDTAASALSLFQDDIISTLDAAMKHETPSFKILALDVLSRIRSSPSKTLIEKYLHDSHENVRRAARLALLNTS